MWYINGTYVWTMPNSVSFGSKTELRKRALNTTLSLCINECGISYMYRSIEYQCNKYTGISGEVPNSFLPWHPMVPQNVNAGLLHKALHNSFSVSLQHNDLNTWIFVNICFNIGKMSRPAPRECEISWWYFLSHGQEACQIQYKRIIEDDQGGSALDVYV